MKKIIQYALLGAILVVMPNAFGVAARKITAGARMQVMTLLAKDQSKMTNAQHAAWKQELAAIFKKNPDVKQMFGNYEQLQDQSFQELQKEKEALEQETAALLKSSLTAKWVDLKNFITEGKAIEKQFKNKTLGKTDLFPFASWFDVLDQWRKKGKQGQDLLTDETERDSLISTIEAAYRDFVGSLRNATRDRLDAIATGKGTGKFMGLGGDSGIGGLITDVKKWTQNNDKTKVIGSQSKSQTRVDYLAEKFNNLVIMPITMMTSGGNDAVLEDKTVLAALGGSTLVMNKKDVAIKVLLHDYELQPKIFGFKSDGSGEQDEAKYPSSLFGLIDAYATYFDTVFFKEKGDQAEGDTLAKFYVFVLEPLLTTVKALAKFFDPIMDGNDRAKFKDMIDKIEKIGKDISAMYDAPEVKELVDEEEGD